MADEYIPWWVPNEHPMRMAGAIAQQAVDKAAKAEISDLAEMKRLADVGRKAEADAKAQKASAAAQTLPKPTKEA